MTQRGGPRGTLKARILVALVPWLDSLKPIDRAAVADAAGTTVSSMNVQLTALVEDGRLKRPWRGIYARPDDPRVAKMNGFHSPTRGRKFVHEPALGPAYHEPKKKLAAPFKGPNLAPGITPEMIRAGRAKP